MNERMNDCQLFRGNKTGPNEKKIMQQPEWLAILCKIGARTGWKKINFLGEGGRDEEKKLSFFNGQKYWKPAKPTGQPNHPSIHHCLIHSRHIVLKPVGPWFFPVIQRKQRLSMMNTPNTDQYPQTHTPLHGQIWQDGTKNGIINWHDVCCQK